MHTRRQFLSGMGAFGAGLLLPSAVRAATAERKLNFIFILVDDMGWPDVGCFGSTYHETPNIDRLAADGMKFTNGYAACPVCSPTRASLITGQCPARLHLTNYLTGRRWPVDSPIEPVDWTTFLDPAIPSLPRILKSAGYATAHMGKWHLGPKHIVEEFGFDLNVAGGQYGSPPSYFSPYKNPTIRDGPEGEYLTDRLGVEADQFIEKNRDRPFFLNLWHYAVHIPLSAKQRMIEKYRNKPHPPYIPGNPIYAAMVEAVDQSVGRILRRVEDAGIADRTVIFFTSDNGGLAVKEGQWQPTSNYPLRAGKGFLYEGGIRVPWIVRWPGVVRAGSVCGVPIISNDVLPTILEMAGITRRPSPLDGLSFVPLLQGGTKPDREALYWHYPHYANQGSTPGGAVRAGDWKLIENYEDDSLELYNLREDPRESRNIADQQPQKTSELRQMLRSWRDEVGAQMPRGRARRA